MEGSVEMRGKGEMVEVDMPFKEDVRRLEDLLVPTAMTVAAEEERSSIG